MSRAFLSAAFPLKIQIRQVNFVRDAGNYIHWVGLCRGFVGTASIFTSFLDGGRLTNRSGNFQSSGLFWLVVNYQA
jgi:hypothetical protein